MSDKDKCMVNEGNTETDQNVTQSKPLIQAEKTDKGIVKSQLNDLREETDNSSQEENCMESGRRKSFGTAQEKTKNEENTTKAEENGKSKERELLVTESRPKKVSHTTAKDAVMPGSWKKGGVPSATLTSPKFSKINKLKISSQKYPCFIPKSKKKVNIQKKECGQLIPVKDKAQFVESTKVDKNSETKCFVNEGVHDESEGHHVKDGADKSDVQQSTGAVQVSTSFNNIFVYQSLKCQNIFFVIFLIIKSLTLKNFSPNICC
jgi:hypothetical protein